MAQSGDIRGDLIMGHSGVINNVANGLMMICGPKQKTHHASLKSHFAASYGISIRVDTTN